MSRGKSLSSQPEFRSVNKKLVAKYNEIVVFARRILLILSAVLDVGSGLRGLLNLPSIPSIGFVERELLMIVEGVIALVGIRQVSNPAWNVILLILGFLAGGLGGLLVIVGAIIGLVASFV